MELFSLYKLYTRSNTYTQTFSFLNVTFSAKRRHFFTQTCRPFSPLLTLNDPGDSSPCIFDADKQSCDEPTSCVMRSWSFSLFWLVMASKARVSCSTFYIKPWMASEENWKSLIDKNVKKKRKKLLLWSGNERAEEIFTFFSGVVTWKQHLRPNLACPSLGDASRGKRRTSTSFLCLCKT